jgi:putative membrane protein
VILSLGIGLFFVNMLMLWLTDEIVPSFEVGGFWSIVGGTLIVWLVNTLLSGLQHRERHGHPDAGARA